MEWRSIGTVHDTSKAWSCSGGLDSLLWTFRVGRVKKYLKGKEVSEITSEGVVETDGR